jgi:hypothetical protein
MPGGTPVGRPWIVVLRTGIIAIDWGDGLFQDAISGDFLHANESQVSHRAQNADLDWLKQVGRVDCYDTQQVYFISLPERSKKSIE